MRYFLSLGSNVEPREDRLRTAKASLAKHGSITKESSLYETEALGPDVDGQPQDWHINQVIEFESALEPEPLLDVLQTIEQEVGRVRRQKWGPRELDLDILLMTESAPSNTSRALETDRLTIPHPELQYRNFILVPLAEIAGDLLHPTLQVSINTLKQASTDTLAVKPYSHGSSKN